MSDMKMAMKAAARSISAMHHPIYPKSASCLPRPGDHQSNEQDAKQNGDVEIEQPPSGIQERLGIKGTIDKEESHEEERRSEEIPYLHRQPPEYVRNLFHIGTKS